MIKFKRKQFIAPIIAALGGPLMTGTMVAGTGISAYQGHKQGEEMKKQGEINQKAMDKQAELMRQQNKQLNKIANQVKTDPAAIGQIGSVLSSKSYSAPMAFIKTVGSAAKDAFTKGAAGNIAMATSMAGATYLGGKYIQHNMKKNKLRVDPNLGLVPKNYSVIGGITNTAKHLGGAVKKEFGPLSLGMGAVLGGVPLVLSYHGNKQQVKNQLNSTGQQQKTYSVISKLVNSTKNGIKTFKSHPMQTITSGAANFGSFGIFNRKSIENFGKKAVDYGTKNKSNAAVNMGNWIQNHKTAAHTLAIAPGLAAAKVTFDGVEKLGNKLGNSVDPGAYEYKNFEDKSVG